MKESQLIKRMNSISKHLDKTKLIDTAYELARTKGKGESKVHSFHTRLSYDFSKEGLRIKLEDGYSMMGGGNITIEHNGKKVLFGDRTIDKDKKRFYPESKGFHIFTYLKGDWENEVEEHLTKEEPKKESEPEEPIDPEVSEDFMNKIKSNFNHF